MKLQKGCSVLMIRHRHRLVGAAAVAVALVVLAATGCGTDSRPLFTALTAEQTGVNFVNELKFDKDFNIYTYRNFYNGGGVAIGDVNNDGLPDLYFTANMLPNRLYLNKGNFVFEDVTQQAGVGGTRAWSTGVSLADVNGDGWLDIYVCNSGGVKGDNKQNELFINLQNGTFAEKAAEYGLDDRGYSTHAAFFDYDKDGDLDCYLLNNSYQAIGSFNLSKNERPKRDTLGGDKLLRNDQNHFTDVSEAAGIYGSLIGFGLGVTVGDVNQDGWQDIYVSNDFFERDYLYLNNANGTFSEVLTDQMPSISAASMGADLADLNNDHFPDFFVTEMLPEGEARLKTKTTFESWDRFQESVKNGYHHQFTRNMLQLNNGDSSFSEIGRLAGVHATDWSWGALLADLDNDGWKDIFVANGIYQDLTDQDYLNFIANEQTAKSIITRNGVNFEKLVEVIPSERIPNYAFANQGDLTFVNKAQAWGLATPSHSNGSAYGDLDNDGDLDLVVNNVNMTAFVYRNETNVLFPKRRFLKFHLKGDGANPFAFGAKVLIRHKGKEWYQEQMPVRGFQSTMDYRLNFGLGELDTVETVVVVWANGKETILTNVPTNQTLALDFQNALPSTGKDWFAAPRAAAPVFQPADLQLPYVHRENAFVDFDRDRLLYHALSSEGPNICSADVNGDGRVDFHVGGAKGMAGELYLQTPEGGFTKTLQPAFEADAVSEDTDAAFFDADGDGDQDLYVASGGNEFPTSSSALADRLYLNDGKGLFTRKNDQILPVGKFEATACVLPHDFDGDGDQDLFVGIRLEAFYYGKPMNGYLLQNDGRGNFKNVTAAIAPQLLELGMITDATWADVDGDRVADLVVVGEWMQVTVFKNDKGKLIRAAENGLGETEGWWNTVTAADLDGDGDGDLIAGNWGHNARFKATPQRPVTAHINDFDANGRTEPIICTYNGAAAYPMPLRHDLVKQIPSLKKKYLLYESYKEQTIEQMFAPDQLKGALVLKAKTLSSCAFLNDGKGRFTAVPLPVRAQFAPVYALLVEDFDGDKKPDILLGGNFYDAKPEVGRYDASYGLLLKGNGDGTFAPRTSVEAGCLLKGEVRDFVALQVGAKRLVLATRNEDKLTALEY